MSLLQHFVAERWIQKQIIHIVFRCDRRFNLRT